jgi:DegV family protein with EDD domain
MARVAVVTDSISCIPPELLKEYEILVIPIGMIINRKVYKDTDLTNDEFWKLFHATRENITTVAINPAEFESTFTELAKITDSVVLITMSKLLSSTHNAACQAKNNLIQKQPNLKIEVMDSKQTTGAEGFIVLEAARAAQSGKTLEEVAATAQELVGKVKMYSTLSTLKYLRRSGRAPKSALIGDWLHIKPILGMTDGSGLVENPARERGLEKAIARMLELAGNSIDSNKPLHLFVHYSDNLAMGEKIKKMMTDRYKCVELYMTPYTPVITSQSGPTVAVSFYQ